MTKIVAVCFDVGETIVDKTREYGTWADWLGVPRHTFSAVFGAVPARGATTAKYSNILHQGSTLKKNAESTHKQASRKRSVKMICIKTPTLA